MVAVAEKPYKKSVVATDTSDYTALTRHTGKHLVYQY